MYITICETDRQSRLDAWQGTQGRCTGMTQGGGMGREGVQDGGNMYTCGGFMSMYGKNHYNIVKELASN